MRGSLVTASQVHYPPFASEYFHSLSCSLRVCDVSIEGIEEGNTFVGFPNPGENHRTCQRDCSHTWSLHVHTVSLLAGLPLLLRGQWCPGVYGLSGFGSPAGSLVSMGVGVGVLCRS